MRTCVMALGAALAGGCAAPADFSGESVPADFVLGVTTYPADAERRARYVVEADGIVRAATGAGVGPRVFPPETRRLTERERGELWARVHATGVLDAGGESAIGSVETLEASENVMAIYVAAGGTGRHAALPLDNPDVRRLAAWLDDAARYGR